MRILWADDQADVIRTLRPLLAPLKAKVVEARSGEDALRLATESDFDLILLDLQMPPEQWGGLWFLERRAEAGILSPVLVLSGEGQQRETIKALRLGVEDYVRKEEVERELVSRIREVLAKHDQQLETELLHSAPALIAIPLKRYLAAASPAARLRRMLELYEAILRQGAFLALAERRAAAEEGNPVGDASISGLAAPAMGSWMRVWVAMRRSLPAESLTRRFDAVVSSQLTDRMIKVRNDLAHAAEPSAAIAQELLDELQPGLRSALAALMRMPLTLIVPTSMRFDGAVFSVEGVATRGDSPAFPSVEIGSAYPVATGRVYAAGAATATLLDLHPLILASEGREPGAWQICLFDGIRGARPNEATLDGAEYLRYSDLWTGERDVDLDPQPTSAELRGLTTDW
jgi:DNA-binding response OmpR family regulator